jgi:hypothetical protein
MGTNCVITVIVRTSMRSTMTKRGSMTLLRIEPNGILLETELSVSRASFRTLRPVWEGSGTHVSPLFRSVGSIFSKRSEFRPFSSFLTEFVRPLRKEKPREDCQRPQSVQVMAAFF